ncbi:MAG TPA: hypothetical protein VGY57_10820, partial [Vicinamibacterales bacterium]|nr:hypothetical protein [Vicinamibacterales bacterium]
MKIVYSPRYRIDIGPHVFPSHKYVLIAERIGGSFVDPIAATWDELALVHTAEYLAKMRDGTLTADDIAELELPWSRELVDAFRLMTGGTIQAALIAYGLEVGSHTSDFRVVCHIGGGLHHAFPNH